MYVELIRSFAKISDLMGKGCREDDNEKRRQTTLNSVRRFVKCEGLCKRDDYSQQDKLSIMHSIFSYSLYVKKTPIPLFFF
jgi:hypothetical protein